MAYFQSKKYVVQTCMTAGYSKRTLVEKLGLKEGTKAVIINHPDDYQKALAKMPKHVTFEKSYRDFNLRKTYNFIQFFVTSQEALKEMFPKLKEHLDKAGMLWISWPKALRQTQGKVRITDLNENIIRDIGLSHGLVDVKVIAVDENWSGLKFVYRLKDR